MKADPLVHVEDISGHITHSCFLNRPLCWGERTTVVLLHHAATVEIVRRGGRCGDAVAAVDGIEPSVFVQRLLYVWCVREEIREGGQSLTKSFP